MEIKQTLQQLEERLLTNAKEVSSLLVSEFREYGSSGQIYSKAEIVDRLRSEPSTNLSLRDFEVQPLCSEVVLATYRAIKHQPGASPVESLRSSIWGFRDGRWQMIFHQGTRASRMKFCCRGLVLPCPRSSRCAQKPATGCATSSAGIFAIPILAALTWRQSDSSRPSVPSSASWISPRWSRCMSRPSSSCS